MIRSISFALAALALSACAAEVASEDPAALSGATDKVIVADSASYLIVTRQDTRRCRYPICGGYFVKRVNQTRTRCADGVQRSECHVVDLDFAATELSAEQGASFTNEVFGPRQGLVRGTLAQRKVGAGDLADTLVVREAWEGQARSTPRGTFIGLESNGIVCITHPCNSIDGEILNVGRRTQLAGVDLAASGASPEAVEAGLAALQSDKVLAAGQSVRVSGPAGQSAEFRASEFYLRVVPKAQGCEPQDATGIGACERFFGYAWDGASCTGVSGCSCQGADCDTLYTEPEECEADHGACGVLACGTRGGVMCAKDEYCDFTAGTMCGAADEGGVCRARPEVCTQIHKPVCGCDGNTYSNACQAAAAGIDASADGPCE